ncbi:MAG TPA: Gfo/Idh/MocA family oxidoreductase [Bryobacteraceae bacterium]|nr:Gfo/Idh/MocA family oxidoreductase [Bryobacteraceae bacterium]
MQDLNLEHVPPPPPRKDYRIGVIGAGFIVRDVQLVAYANARYNVRAIASANPEQARAVAAHHGIPKVYDTWRELAADPSIEVVDLAVPPGEQPAILKELPRIGPQLKGVLAQKPLALNYAQSKEAVQAFDGSGITLSVNQNMRYDQSIRALKSLLTRGRLGEPVLATIEMRAIPHWQPWSRKYGRLTLLIMSIHHLDAFRYLFGDPESVYVSVRTDPRTKFPHRDGIPLYILEYASGLRASAWDDVWAGPAREGAASDIYIKWRVEGTEGMAWGTIGWPSYPNATPSTIHFTTTREPGVWFSPQWKEVWFPDAFEGTMGQLLTAIATGAEPAVTARDNLRTMALVEACYRSIDEHRPVSLKEIMSE